MKNIIINVAFNITNPLHDLIIETSLKIKKRYGSKWYIDDKKYHLHLSMYLFAMPSKNIDKLKDAAKEYLRLVNSTHITIADMVTTSSGLILLNFVNTPKLYEYHTKALEIFNPLREGELREKQKSENYMSKLLPVEIDLLKKYGHIYVLDRFQPHITLAKIEEDTLAQQIISTYKNIFVGKKSQINRLQIQEARFGTDDKTFLLVNEKLANLDVKTIEI